MNGCFRNRAPGSTFNRHRSQLRSELRPPGNTTNSSLLLQTPTTILRKLAVFRQQQHDKMAGKAAASSANPLVIPGRPDTSFNVQLHPLVLLTISDYITRHTIRKQETPVVGAIIGQQHGRDFTLEHAFECKSAQRGENTVLDEAWFRERLDMYKEVHKAPALDMVALFTLGPVIGPQPAHLPVLKQVQEITGSDSIMLLLFHVEQVDHLQGGKLPISLYDSVEEAEGAVKFKELAFDVDSGDAEMIGVNFVAVGGGNATAVPKADASSSGGASSSKAKTAKSKGKGKEKDDEGVEVNGSSSANILSPEDDELISTLNSKVNAIKMLNERINLIRTYLETLPDSYLTDVSSTSPAPDNTNFALLRSVNSMLSRLPLLAPPTSSTLDSTPDTTTPISTLQQASETEKQDVHLTSLLASLTRATQEASNLGSKFSVLQREKQSKERHPFRGGHQRGLGGNMFGDDGIADGAGL